MYGNPLHFLTAMHINERPSIAGMGYSGALCSLSESLSSQLPLPYTRYMPCGQDCS